MAIRTFARAKINLCLHVTGARSDGYHLLDSIVAFAGVGDQLTFEACEDLSLTIDGPFAKDLEAGSDNLILQAGKCFAGSNGCNVRLLKNLPVAAGIGGGSADAAAALHGFSSHWGLDLPDMATQLQLGADVPVCVKGSAVRMKGIGQELTPLNFLPDLPVVLINPGVAVSTALVFGALGTTENSEIMSIPKTPLSVAETIIWLASQRNDLQPPAIALEPAINRVMEVLELAGAELVRMSGSGATCFGVFKSRKAAENAVEHLNTQHPEWWVVSTVLRGSGRPGNHEI